MMFVLFPSFADSDDTEKTLLVVLFAVTVIMSFFALRKVFERWRRTASELSIQPGVGATRAEVERARAEQKLGEQKLDAGAGGPGAAYSPPPIDEV